MTPPRGSRKRDDLDLFEAPRRRSRRRSRIARRRRAGIVAGVLGGAAGVALLTVGFGGAVAYREGCSLSSLQQIAIGQNTFVYAADGSLLGSIPAERNRQPVAYAQVSPWLPKATVAVEDKRFWHHGGIDPIGMTRALWADVRAGKVVQGGSTITQQLVRNLYISRERTVTRKLREACLALKLASKWSKRRILTAYLNQIYYGSQAYGVEAAAQTYFSKPAKKLTLSQAALLAGLPQAPSNYDPFRNPDAALRRRNEVLRAMLTTGAINADQYYASVGDPDLQLKPGRLYKEIRQPYFFSYVRDELVRVYGEARVRSGGLRVRTTIDPSLQRAARKAIRDTLDLPTDPAAAVVAIDPATGAIRAMEAVYPGRAQNQYNLIAQAHRQAGSTFKTFVLTAAILKGVNPESTSYLSAPLHCDTGPCIPPWDVQTYDHTYVGGISIANATLRSDNTVYARLTLDVGAESVARAATLLGVRTPLAVNGAYVPAMGLGAIAVTPLDMASAYATLAAGGVYSQPMAITKVILPNGKDDTSAGWGTPQRERVIPDGVAYEVTKILQENVLYGTGVGAQLPDRTAAGKTGTTDRHNDAWFCGYTPQLQATVWVGYPQGEIPMENVHGIAVAGGTFPATIWRLFMSAALAHAKPLDFPQPKRLPAFATWHGQYAYGAAGFDAYATQSTSTDTATAATTTKSTPTPSIPAPTTTEAPPPPPPPPTTTEPPPTTTEPPPVPGPPAP